MMNRDVLTVDQSAISIKKCNDALFFIAKKEPPGCVELEAT